jgi:hypothetical protein
LRLVLFSLPPPLCLSLPPRSYSSL